MDQDAFRSLLATPARSPSSANAPARFGRPPPKRAAAQASSSSTDLKPRKVSAASSSAASSQKPKRNPDGSLYRDRAAERRAGRDGDFADAEKLLEDFKTRSETAGVSKDVLEDQMKYLGGDEHHSILVKGLDIALLERKKAELARKAEQELDDVEDELDAAFESPAAAAARPGPPPPLAPSGASPPRLSRPTSAAAAPAPKRKKTRDELLAELKAMRSGPGRAPGPAAESAGADAAAGPSRFKPIGSTSSDKKGKGQEVASAWRAVGANATDGGGSSSGGEKKKRKKRKVVPSTDEPSTTGTTTASSVSTAQTDRPGAEGRSSSTFAESAAAAGGPPLPVLPTPDDLDDDMDIFGGAGDYKGLDTDEEDSDGAAATAAATANRGPPPLASSTFAAGKRKYFDDDDDDEDDGNKERITTSTAPTGLEDLAAKQAAANAAAAAAGGTGAAAGEEGGGGREREARPMRLEGLSGAGPSVKELLEMDKAAEAEEKRQARKLKAKEKAEARRANMTEADKANQDYQKMMAHLEKKEGTAGKKHSP